MGAFADATKRLRENLTRAGYFSDNYKNSREAFREKLEQMEKRAVGADKGIQNDINAWYDAESNLRFQMEHLASMSTFEGLFGEINQLKKTGVLPKAVAVGGGGEAKSSALQAKLFGEALAKGFKENSRTIAWVVLIISILLLVWVLVDVLFGFVQTPFGTLVKQSLEQYIPISEFRTGVSNQLCMLGCYASSITSVGSWTAAGGLDKYCQLTCKIGAEAEQLGCSNCYALSTILEEPTPIPLVTDTIKMEINTPEGKRYQWGIGGTNVIVPIPPAQNPTVSITSNDFLASINEQYLCDSFNPAKPNECRIKTSVGPYDVPLKISADFKAPCKTSSQYNAIFAYTYNVTGLSFIKFKAKGYAGTISTPQPTSSPGPLKFNAEPYTDIYPTDANEARITFSLVNQGSAKSQIKVNSLVLDQVAPSGYGNFTQIECIEADEKSLGGGSYSLELTPSVQPGDENAVNFHCSLTVPNDIKTKLTQAAYYTIVATAKYIYTDRIVGDTVYPDPRYRCVVSLKDWNQFVCVDSKTNTIRANSSCVDYSSNWVNWDFDDALWNKVTLPDTSWGCTDCDRLYRLDNIVWDGTKDVWLNVSSDDAARCWVSSKGGNPKPITGCQAKLLCEGLLCKGYSQKGGWGDFLYDDSFYTDTRTMSDPAYRCKIGDSGNPSGSALAQSTKEPVFNTISCQVHNSGTTPSSGFNMITSS